MIFRFQNVPLRQTLVVTLRQNKYMVFRLIGNNIFPFFAIGRNRILLFPITPIPPSIEFFCRPSSFSDKNLSLVLLYGEEDSNLLGRILTSCQTEKSKKKRLFVLFYCSLFPIRQEKNIFIVSYQAIFRRFFLLDGIFTNMQFLFLTLFFY